MEELILFISTFVFIFMIYYLTTIRKELYTKKNRKRRKPRKNIKPSEIRYLEMLLDIDFKNVNYKKLLYFLGVVISFELSLIITIATFFKSVVMQILVILVLLPLMLFVTFKLISNYLKNKGEKDV